MNRDIACKGHSFRVNLPDSLFEKGPLIIPCTKCRERYLVRNSGEIVLVEKGSLVRSILAMHY